MKQPDQQATQRIMALTVLSRVIELVHDIARTGEINQGRIEFLLNSLFVEPHDPSSIYANTKNMQQAMCQLRNLLDGENIEAVKRTMPHVISLITLEKKLSKQPDMLQLIGTDIKSVQKQKTYFGSLTHESVIAALADIYGSTVSTLSPRVVVRGKPEFLKVSYNTNTIRSLLFVGIRAAHMWRTNGGHKWRLIFGRRMMIRDINQILDGLNKN